MSYANPHGRQIAKSSGGAVARFVTTQQSSAGSVSSSWRGAGSGLQAPCWDCQWLCLNHADIDLKPVCVQVMPPQLALAAETCLSSKAHGGMGI